MHGKLRFLGALVAALIGITWIIPAMAAGPADKGLEDSYARPPIHGRKATSNEVPGGYTPTQIRRAYGFDQLSATGAGQVIAIVDAFDDPTAASDLATFIGHFGLPPMYGLGIPGYGDCTVENGPHPCFEKVFAQGGRTRTNGSWALETALDTQWAHAIAPGADILLVQAQTNSFANLLGAVDVAANSGAKVVSMSWGGGDFSSAASHDFHFNKAGVTFTASSGDSGNGVMWPAASPYVIAVGGTTLTLDDSGNLIADETAWSGSGGGISAYEAQPGYQSAYATMTNVMRGVPDVSYNADPSTGVAVYVSTPNRGESGWFIVGGTSAGAPQWAALVALVDQGRSSALASNSLTSSGIYDAAGGRVYANNYRDITSGNNGTCGSVCQAAAGYDLVTGLGSPMAGSLVPYLTKH